MRKFQRAAEPDFLTNRWEKWGLEWEERHAENPRASFHWHQFDGEQVNQKLLPLLKSQTQDHCSFCDNFPVSPPSIDTIEHFRPKAHFPRQAYQWENLYFCCMYCQQKSDEFDERILQPDALDYEFERYFRWDYTLGTIEINEQASDEDQQRAEITRKIYRLNEGHPSLRKRELRRRNQGLTDPLDDFAYRDYIAGTQ
ncbi:MAG: hypothetical protein RLZZ505_789 [Verrucomicrobiota bacterium]|jgi:uncharacterized protein (TIGR02646 family)